jgi:hypothetical protein
MPPPIDKAEIERRFTSHAVSPGKAMAMHDLRAAAALLASAIVELTPECREQSTAITKLEEAVFWANAAIARDAS